MTIDEARNHIGQRVSYQPHPHHRPELGVVTSVGALWVFVRYDGDNASKATRPGDLTPTKIGLP